MTNSRAACNGGTPSPIAPPMAAEASSATASVACAKRRRIFTLSDYYLPGFKSGGPLRTISHMVAWMRSSCEFFIFTRDRDATDMGAYAGVEAGRWTSCGDARVFYAAPTELGFASIRRRCIETKPEVVYLNSFFSTLTIRYLCLRQLGMVPRVPVVLAPRGELSPGALRLKPRKKALFMWIAWQTRLYHGLRWQASAELEAAEIRAVLPFSAELMIAPDLTPPPELQHLPAATPRKESGELRLVFCSRIAEKKNLHALVPLLGRLRGKVDWQIYGPIRDTDYWERCRALVAQLPDNATVEWRGEIPHERVAETLAQHHFFVLPTLSENFGHAIIEALAAGCPVIISDQTPWLDIEVKGAGWVVPVADAVAWETALQAALAMGEAEYRNMADRARAYGAHHVAHPPVEASRALFDFGLKA